jgi:hypothetical protein
MVGIKKEKKKMNYTEIWTGTVLPIVASLGGFGGIITIIISLIKSRVNIELSSSKAANKVLEGVKNGISVDINELVESKLKTATVALESLKEYNLDTLKLVFENLTTIQGELMAIGDYLKNSVTTSKTDKEKLTKSLGLIKNVQTEIAAKVSEATKIAPKAVRVVLNKETATKSAEVVR